MVQIWSGPYVLVFNFLLIFAPVCVCVCTYVRGGAAEQQLGHRAVGQALDRVVVSILEKALSCLYVPYNDCVVCTS